MVLEPLLRFRKVRTESGHLTPKTARMVQLTQMRELVQHDVVAHEHRCLYQPPIERDGSVPRTGTPARALIPNRHALHWQLVQGRQLQHAGREFPGCQTPKMALDSRAQIGFRTAEA